MHEEVKSISVHSKVMFISDITDNYYWIVTILQFVIDFSDVTKLVKYM